MNVTSFVEWVPEHRAWIVALEARMDDNIVGEACVFVDKRMGEPGSSWGGWPFLLERLAKSMLEKSPKVVPEKDVPGM